MNTALKLDPLIYEFETKEAADAYDDWYRAKVNQAISNPAPRIPHDEVVARMRRLCGDDA